VPARQVLYMKETDQGPSAAGEDYVKVAVLEHEIEARLLASILEERHIPFRMRSYHDTAYDGLFQAQKGWGVVNAPLKHESAILEIIEELRQKAAEHRDA
jgi:hypothetical protein